MPDNIYLEHIYTYIYMYICVYMFIYIDLSTAGSRGSRCWKSSWHSTVTIFCARGHAQRFWKKSGTSTPNGHNFSNVPARDFFRISESLHQDADVFWNSWISGTPQFWQMFRKNFYFTIGFSIIVMIISVVDPGESWWMAGVEYVYVYVYDIYIYIYIYIYILY